MSRQLSQVKHFVNAAIGVLAVMFFFNLIGTFPLWLCLAITLVVGVLLSITVTAIFDGEYYWIGVLEFLGGYVAMGAFVMLIIVFGPP